MLRLAVPLGIAALGMWDSVAAPASRATLVSRLLRYLLRCVRSRCTACPAAQHDGRLCPRRPHRTGAFADHAAPFAVTRPGLFRHSAQTPPSRSTCIRRSSWRCSPTSSARTAWPTFLSSSLSQPTTGPRSCSGVSTSSRFRTTRCIEGEPRPPPPGACPTAPLRFDSCSGRSWPRRRRTSSRL